MTYPSWVCRECGLEASGGRCFEVSTFHVAKCDVCGEKKPVTESRDFYYPEFKIKGDKEMDELSCEHMSSTEGSTIIGTYKKYDLVDMDCDKECPENKDRLLKAIDNMNKRIGHIEKNRGRLSKSDMTKLCDKLRLLDERIKVMEDYYK